MIRAKYVVVIFLSIGLVSGVVAQAQQAALTDDQVKERLGFITGALEAGQPRARTWLYGWLGAYSAGAATMGVLAATNWKSEPDIQTFAPVPPVDNSFAQDMLVGSGTFALGVVGLVMDPFTPATAAKKLRALPGTTDAERSAKLKRAEELLRECARRERSGRGLTTHLLNAGVNAAAGVVTVAAFDRPFADGLVTFAVGEAVSLLNIFTQPMRATRDLKKYEAGYPMAATPAAPRVTWSLGVRPGGFAFSLQF
ncbi:MAG TPA: hypothetical protein VLJ16_08500 [Acidobacteriota bacterium]|nr:hypothetical protein [Acidobacteriota bacterium]